MLADALVLRPARCDQRFAVQHFRDLPGRDNPGHACILEDEDSVRMALINLVENPSLVVEVTPVDAKEIRSLRSRGRRSKFEVAPSGRVKIEGVEFVQADIAKDHGGTVRGEGGPIPNIPGNWNSRNVGQFLDFTILNTNAVHGVLGEVTVINEAPIT
jgi:hypothetical protein